MRDNSRLTRVHVLHAHADRGEAAAIAQWLEARGCCVTKGDPLSRADAGVFCPLLSPTSVRDGWPPLPRGVRIVPIVLRECAVPGRLRPLNPVDASDGVAERHVRQAILHAVLGPGVVPVRAVQQARRAFEESRAEAARQAPDPLENVRAIESVARLPVQELEIRLDPETFPAESGVFLELRLRQGTVEKETISFLFAPYREGRTWPRQMGFPEAPYTSFFDEDAARIDARLLWRGGAWLLEQVLDRTDLGDARGTWRIVLDGAGLGPSSRRGRESGAGKPRGLAPLAALAASGIRFELIEHRAGGRRPVLVDLKRTDILLTVHAFFQAPEPVTLRLFQSRHDPSERAVLARPPASGPRPGESAAGLGRFLRGPSLDATHSPILREAILGLYEPLQRAAAAARERARQRAHALVRSREPRDPREIRAAARLHRLAADLAVGRGQLSRAIVQGQEAMRLLEPLVFRPRPEHADAFALFRLARRVVECFLELDEPGVAAGLATNPRVIAEKLLDSSGAEPDYRRLLAEANALESQLAELRGDYAAALRLLEAQVSLLRGLCRPSSHAACLKDWQLACEQAVACAGRWGLAGRPAVRRWRRELSGCPPLSSPDSPAWCGPASRRGWPVRLFTSPLVRCRAGVPAAWDSYPVRRPSRREAAQVFRGAAPEEFLTVTLVESAGRPFRISPAEAEFPAPEMFDGPKPKLLSWGSESDSAGSLARRLDVEWLALFQGVFLSPPPGSGAGRLYVLLGRRGRLWWRVALSLPSACLPGAPASIVEVQDHARAAGVFGLLEFL